MLMQQADENNNTVQIYSQSQGNDSKEGSPGIAEHGAMDPYKIQGRRNLHRVAQPALLLYLTSSSARGKVGQLGRAKFQT